MNDNDLTPRTGQQQWAPTARSEHGRRVQASRYRQALVEAIAERGRQIGAEPGQVSEAIEHADTMLRSRGWHPEQLPYGDPVDDFVNGVDVDYDPRMAAYDRQHHTDNDEDTP
jgi:hypothetical protein